jgi:hypothetical protein
VILLGVGLWFTSAGISAIRRGHYSTRGGFVISRRRNPWWFWSGVLATFLVPVTALFLVLFGGSRH